MKETSLYNLYNDDKVLTDGYEIIINGESHMITAKRKEYSSGTLLIDGKEIPIIPKGYVSWDLEYNSEYFFEVEERSGHLAIIDLVKIN